MTAIATEILVRKYERNAHRTIFAVVGERGGMHFWFHEDSDGEKHGGIEQHSRKPMYDWDRAPSNDKCWLLDGPCWHDGSSLQAEEFWIPLYNATASRGGSFEAIFLALEGEYRRQFDAE